MNSYYLLEKLEKLRNLIDTKSSAFEIIKGIAEQSDLVFEFIDTLEIVVLPANYYLQRFAELIGTVTAVSKVVSQFPT